MIPGIEETNDPNGWTEEGWDEGLKMLEMLEMLEVLEELEVLEMLDGHNLLSFLHSSYSLEELLQEPSPRIERHARRSNSAGTNFSQSKKDQIQLVV